MSDLGDRLRRYRERAGLSIYDVGKLTGRHFSTISKYERGERKPNVDTLRELAGTYKVHPARLITRIEDIEGEIPEEVAAASRLLRNRRDIADLLPELEKLNCRQLRALHEFLAALCEQE